MSDNPKFLAVRRNLQPGYIAFKQDNYRLLYTLDNVTWHVAFNFTSLQRANGTDYQQAIYELVQVYGENIPINAYADDASKVKGQVELSASACGLAFWIVELYSEAIREALEQEKNNALDVAAFIAALGAFAVGIIAAIPTGGVSLGLSAASYNALIVMFGALGLLFEGLQHADIFRPLTDAEKESMRCCIANALKSSFSANSLKTLVCDEIPLPYLTKFHELASAPEFWAGVVIAIQENTITATSNCCGETCGYIMPAAAASIVSNTTRKKTILISNNNNPPLSTEVKEKALQATYTSVPRAITSVSVDIYAANLYSQVGVLYVELINLQTNGVVQGSKLPILDGVNTYNLPVVGGGKALISGFTIKVEIARANKTYLTQWNAAYAEIRAIKYCYNE